VADAYQRFVRSRIQMPRGYAETTGCLRQYLLGSMPGRAEFPPNTAVRHGQWDPGCGHAGRTGPVDRPLRRRGLQTLSMSAVTEQNLLTEEWA
jgi:ATP-dependent DNA helicase RecQ